MLSQTLHNNLLSEKLSCFQAEMSVSVEHLFSPDDLDGNYLEELDPAALDEFVVNCYNNGYDLPVDGCFARILRVLKIFAILSIPVNYVLDIINGVLNIYGESSTVEIAIGVAMMLNIILVPMILNFITLLLPKYRIVTEFRVRKL